MVLVTLLPVNIIGRQKPTWKRKDKPQLDMTMFRDAPFLLMTAGESTLNPPTQSFTHTT